MEIDVKELALKSRDLKLLYVEDDKAIQASILKILKHYFLDITTAYNGQEGLEKFNNGSFDLILSDINMPKLNGLEMLSEIRKKNSTIPVLLLSAHNDAEYFVQAIELDVDGYILKPLVYEQFLKALFKVVQKINLLAMNENYQKHLEYEVKKQNEELFNKLHIDSLTGLGSRYAFFEDISILTIPTIFLIDINKFKVINEVYGYSIGSYVLEKFAETIHEMVEERACRAYRLSADEFALVASVNPIEPIQHTILLEHFFQKLNTVKILVDQNRIKIDVCIALSVVEKDGYECAKIALSYAKKHHKSYIVYSEDIDYRKESCKTLECRDQISSALEENRVTSLYQPILNVHNEIVMYETLMRLKDKKTQTYLLPAYFLEVAKKDELYNKLSSFTIFKTLELLATTDTTLSINFSFLDIKNNELLQRIEEFFSLHVTVASRCIFELKESENVNMYIIKGFVQRFKNYGVNIAVDNFGIGVPSFEYILEIEPEYLKIDASLIENIDTDSRAYALVTAIVQFSHKLGIKVIAVGVHSKSIFEMLKTLDVDAFQGFYFSKAVERNAI